MASFVLKDAFVGYTTGSSTGAITNVSSYVRSVAISYEADTQEDTAMGDDSRSFVGGLKSMGLSIEFNQDFAGSGPGSGDVWNNIGTTFWWRVRPTSTSPGSTNPEYRGSFIGLNYGPVDGAVGDLAMTSLELQGKGDLTRGTTTTTG